MTVFARPIWLMGGAIALIAFAMGALGKREQTTTAAAPAASAPAWVKPGATDAQNAAQWAASRGLPLSAADAARYNCPMPCSWRSVFAGR